MSDFVSVKVKKYFWTPPEQKFIKFFNFEDEKVKSQLNYSDEYHKSKCVTYSSIRNSQDFFELLFSLRIVHVPP